LSELGVEILAWAGMALEGFHVEPTHGRLLSIGDDDGAR
jgi:hypothetical protein